MSRRHLVAVATAQLAVGAAGQAIAVHRGLAYDFTPTGWQGKPEHVGRDAWLLGTTLSAPVSMLGVQAGAIARLTAGPSAAAVRTLGGLGGMMVFGYLGERGVRLRLSADGWDPVESPIAATGLALAATMVLLSFTSSRGRLGARDGT